MCSRGAVLWSWEGWGTQGWSLHTRPGAETVVRAWGALLHQAGSAGHLVGPRARGGSASPGLSLCGPEGPSRPGRAPGHKLSTGQQGFSLGRDGGGWLHADHHARPWRFPPARVSHRGRDRPRPGHLHAPEMAWTATRRKPFTSPFSLTTATRCTSGTGYSRLLRYTKALGRGEAAVRAARRAPRRAAAEAAGRAHDTTLQSRRERAARRGQPGWGKSGQGSGAGGRRGGGGLSRGQGGGGLSLLQGRRPGTTSLTYDPHAGADAPRVSPARFPGAPDTRGPHRGPRMTKGGSGLPVSLSRNTRGKSSMTSARAQEEG